jgi:mono/diheme cytochrome c family protein
MIKLFFASFVTLALTASAAENAPKPDISKLPPAATTKNVTYAGHIQKIFQNSCVGCHGPKKVKGRLRLDTLEAAMKGGESGKVIIPGKSAESPLVLNVAGLGDEDHHMPPPKNKAGIKPLTAEEIGLLRAWIDQGAK